LAYPRLSQLVVQCGLEHFVDRLVCARAPDLMTGKDRSHFLSDCLQLPSDFRVREKALRP
jgi:hypothetical protein